MLHHFFCSLILLTLSFFCFYLFVCFYLLPSGCSDHASHGPHYVHAACQYDGPSHSADEPSVPGHYRKCEQDSLCHSEPHTDNPTQAHIVAVIIVTESGYKDILKCSNMLAVLATTCCFECFSQFCIKFLKKFLDDEVQLNLVQLCTRYSYTAAILQ